MEIPFRDRLAAPPKDVCSYAGFGPTTCFKLLKEGKLESVMIGRRRLIRVSSVLRLLGEKAAA